MGAGASCLGQKDPGASNLFLPDRVPFNSWRCHSETLVSLATENSAVPAAQSRALWLPSLGAALSAPATAPALQRRPRNFVIFRGFAIRLGERNQRSKSRGKLTANKWTALQRLERPVEYGLELSRSDALGSVRNFLKPK